MYQESFDEMHKQGLEHLSGGNKWLLYFNERKENDLYVYDVVEFDGKPTDNEIKVALIGEQYTINDEVKMLRKVVAAMLVSMNVNSEAVEAFSGYNKKVCDIINAVDNIGKVVQTLEGNGTIENPFKGWSVGMSVEEGKWYLTSEGWLWECIKSGTPTSETDREYFDVVGI